MQIFQTKGGWQIYVCVSKEVDWIKNSTTGQGRNSNQVYSSLAHLQMDHAASTRPDIFLRGRKTLPVDIVFPQNVTSPLNI